VLIFHVAVAGVTDIDYILMQQAAPPKRCAVHMGCGCRPAALLLALLMPAPPG